MSYEVAQEEIDRAGNDVLPGERSEEFPACRNYVCTIKFHIPGLIPRHMPTSSKLKAKQKIPRAERWPPTNEKCFHLNGMLPSYRVALQDPFLIS
jgi:hypothetical protein